MKIRSLLLSTLCMLLAGTAFTACSDDDDNRHNDEGSQLVLPDKRVFILCEGTWNQNNASLTFYAPNHETETIGDIYFKQNNARLGDTGQYALADDDDIYVCLSGSRYVARLNAAGVEQARYAFTNEQGDPRGMEIEDGKLYVTLSSGNVARLDARTLTVEKTVAVGKNPEQLVEEDGKLYVVNSGFGTDNRLSIIDLRTFDKAEHVEIIQNPQSILEANDQLFIQGYGSNDYLNYTYPVICYDRAKQTYKEIGKGTYMAECNDIVYIIYSETDYVTYSHTLYSYNARTGTKNDAPFVSMPEELKGKIITGFGINPDNGDFYIATSDYVSNGDVYRFRKDGTFVEKFEAGVTPKYFVFID